MPTALPDTKYQIRNVDSFVGLNGFTSTIIRQKNQFILNIWEHLNVVTLSIKLELAGTTTIAPNGKRRVRKSRISWQLPKLRSKHFYLERKLGRLRTIVMSAPKVVRNCVNSVTTPYNTLHPFLQTGNHIQHNFLWQPAMSLRLRAILVNTLLFYLFWSEFAIIWRGYLILTKH